MEKLKVIQIGVGGFGTVRRTLMRKSGKFELLAGYDLNPENLAAMVKEDGAKAVNSFDELLATPGAEAMMICSGAPFHAEQIIAAAEKGLHVFVEKPLCSTLEEVKAIKAVQLRTGVVIAVGHHDHHHDPLSSLIKRKIDSGEMGTISCFEKTICHSGGQLIKPGDWRGVPEKNPGGMLFQCGVHGFHELLYYFGPVKEVQAMMRYDVNPATRTADAAHCLVRFESGVTGVLNAYHVSPYHYTTNIYGSRQNLYCWDYSFNRGVKVWEQTDYLDSKEQPLVEIPVEIVPPRETFDNLVNFYNAVKTGTPPSPSLQDGINALAPVLAAEISARTGQAVSLASLGV